MNEEESTQEIISKGVLGLAVGVSLLFAGYWAGRQLHSVWDTWPMVDGVVVSSTVAEVTGIPPAKGDIQFHQFEPKINVRFPVYGWDYTSEIPLGFTTGSFEKASSNLKGGYAAGTHVSIRYNPEDPQEIRLGKLERGPLAFAFVLIGVGVLLSVGGVHDLGKGYSRRAARATEVARDAVGARIQFQTHVPEGSKAATIRCPACGTMVDVGKDACPNCSKSLRAA